MYIVALLMAVGFGVLLFLSRGEETAPAVSSLLRPLYRVAGYLCRQFAFRFPGLFAAGQVEQDLMRLCPGEAGEILTRNYYVKKIALCLGILLLGTLFGVGVKAGVGGSVILGEDGSVTRGSRQEGSRQILLAAAFGDKEMDFQVQVEPRALSGEEAEELFDAFLDNLSEYILGENESLQTVTGDLILEEEYEGLPMTVEWESSRYDLLDSQGHVFAPGEAETVTLSVCLKCGVYEREDQINVVLTPPEYTEEELLYLQMTELLEQTQADSAEQERWMLPSEWQGEPLFWRQVVEDHSLSLWAAALGTAGLVYLFMDRDLHERLEKRKKKLRREYPEILHRLVLFVGAGMTIRGALQKIAGDYENKRQNGARDSPACEEIVYACRELRAGVSEAVVYEHLGRRTGLQEYVRLSTLLTQNLKRGNRTLLERLREEADKAAQEQLRQGRKLGEEAGTKLLAPMVLMLAVVMVIIMIPAFSAM